ncbi:unnamed protein product [Clonostachys rosea f. rosea IK726]|uniref:Uncharacterized protein n=1 Tax=Clonostachys rosea f. rosea IK726 TaxID=1349383 RepID=A0ACA9U204_BIOOC|nr:unnamed protein product [Clonostachys rosea f. rosea IK726]
MALKQNIQSLPMEVLDCVFSHMGDKESVKQSRLVSRAFNNAAAPYLIDEAQVRVTSKSLSRLEELCNHDIFSKSITDVTIILSQYDVSLAMDRSLFMQDCTGRLLRNMEMRERMGAYKWRRMIASRCRKRVPPFSFQDKNREDALQREIEQQLWQLMYFNPVLLKISEEGFDEKEATPFQQVAMRLYSRYRERCQDQERVRRGNNHIDRICSALAKLPNLCNLRFDDPYLIVDEELQASDFPDLGFDRRMLEHFDCILSPSRWCGSHTTNSTIVPPVEMLGELCARLGQSGTRPRLVWVGMTAPAVLWRITLSRDQQAGLKLLMSKVTHARLDVDGWESSEPPRNGMLGLCSFTKPFFTAPDLETLKIDFVNYTSRYQTPEVSLSDLLPLESPWQHLDTLILSYQPATIEDLRALVALQADTITTFKWDYGWLLSGRWSEAVEVLRGFRKLETVSLEYPKGERFGTRVTPTCDVPYEEMYSYILKETDVNPLIAENTS